MVAKIDVECPDVCNIMYEYKEIYKNRYNYPAHAHPNLANYYLHVAGCVRACDIPMILHHNAGLDFGCCRLCKDPCHAIPLNRHFYFLDTNMAPRRYT